MLHVPESGSSILRDSDRKSTRLNSSHLVISYAVFCLKKNKDQHHGHAERRHTVVALAAALLRKDPAVQPRFEAEHPLRPLAHLHYHHLQPCRLCTALT